MPLLLLPLFLVAIGLYFGSGDKKVGWFLFFLIACMPASYVLMAYRSGHTISFNPTYNMFNAGFFTIAMALSLACWEKIQVKWMRYGLLAVFVIQAAIMYVSAHPRNAHFMEGPDDYYSVAMNIAEKYEEGDLVIWPDFYVAQVGNLHLRQRTDIQQSVASKP